MPSHLDIEGRSVPQPQYKTNATKLVNEYRKAMLDLQMYVSGVNLSSLSRANAVITIKHIEKRLLELDLFAADWVATNIPIAAMDGTAAALVNLGIAKNMQEALLAAKFNELNTNMVELYIADTNEDMLALTNNIRKQTRNAIRQVSGEIMRQQMAKGENGIESQNRIILSQLREKLGDSIHTVIIDAGRNHWKPADYVDMLTRTKMLETHRQATANEAVDRGAYYATISNVGSKDACRFHEGRIVKLIATAEGNYPTIDELKASNQIFHPRCRHHFSVFRKIERLPNSVRETAEKQHERGNAALATGKRNPDVE